MKLKPVLVETKEDSQFIIQKCIKRLSDVNVGELRHTQRMLHNEEYFSKLHIYLVDPKAEINCGDYILTNIFAVVKMDHPFKGELAIEKQLGSRKIICSTDRSLKLPQLSEQSIKLLIECYNSNGDMPESIEVKTGIIGMTEGWVPSYNNPDNNNLDPESEPIYGIITNDQKTVDIILLDKK